MYAVYNSNLCEIHGVFKTFEEAEAFRNTMSFKDATEDMHTHIATEDEMYAEFEDDFLLEEDC